MIKVLNEEVVNITLGKIGNILKTKGVPIEYSSNGDTLKVKFANGEMSLHNQQGSPIFVYSKFDEDSSWADFSENTAEEIAGWLYQEYLENKDKVPMLDNDFCYIKPYHLEFEVGNLESEKLYYTNKMTEDTLESSWDMVIKVFNNKTTFDNIVEILGNFNITVEFAFYL